MKLSLIRELLLEPLSVLNSISTSKNLSFPILSNILFSINEDKLVLSATDLEVELSVTILNRSDSTGNFTIPCRKFYDIVKKFPEGSFLNFSFTETKVTISCARSRFVLSILPANEFPLFKSEDEFSSLKIKQSVLKTCIANTEFCMALKDVRYYLNGLLFEIHNKFFTCVTTDGHRLAFYQTDEISDCNFLEFSDDSKLQVLLPRKSILDIYKLLYDSDDLIEIQIASGFVKFIFNGLIFTTKLIDSKFPEYNRVIPKETNLSIEINRQELRDTLLRAAILSTDKFKAIRIDFSDGKLITSLHNSEHEEMEEELSINYSGVEFTIGFNINYIIDALNHIQDTNIVFNFTESLNSCLLHGITTDLPLYVVMPMRL
ncbi:MAG: DNA polymerase III subunit beta [Pseudomonadota bacterium]